MLELLLTCGGGDDENDNAVGGGGGGGRSSTGIVHLSVHEHAERARWCHELPKLQRVMGSGEKEKHVRFHSRSQSLKNGGSSVLRLLEEMAKMRT